MLPPESQQVTADPNTNTVFMVWKFKNDISQQALLEGFQSLCALVINVNHTAANRYSPEKGELGDGYQPQRLVDARSAEATTERARGVSADSGS